MKVIKIALLFGFLLLHFVSNANFNAPIKIIKFETVTGIKNTDSLWNINENIVLNVPPTLLNITLESEDINADIYCILYEPLTRYDTLYLGKNRTLNLFNLIGGDYQLSFFNKNDGTNTSLSFKIKPEFWNDWWFSPFVLLIISSIFALLFYSFYLIRLRHQLRLQKVSFELEIKALKAQMNPHFIFNSMNTIDAYILNKRFIEASDFLQKFSKLIRRILHNSDFTTVSLTNELATLKIYIELEQERFSNSFTYSVSVAPELDLDKIQIPPLLIQPFIENSILHGIRHLTDGSGHINLDIDLKNNELYIEISDNGIGRAKSAIINNERHSSQKSMGSKITFDRILNYQALFGPQTQPEIQDLANGTKVKILLPLNFQENV